MAQIQWSIWDLAANVKGAFTSDELRIIGSCTLQSVKKTWYHEQKDDFQWENCIKMCGNLYTSTLYLLVEGLKK